MVVPLPAEPGWFYSSISQVTSGLVGFLGGALVIRIQVNRSRWRGAKQEFEKELRKFHRYLKRGYNEDSRRRLEEQLETIQDLAIEGQNTQLPSELSRFAWFLVGLLVLGVVLPLAALEAPEILVRILLPVGVSLLTCLAVLFLFRDAARALEGYKEDYRKKPRSAESELHQAKEESRNHEAKSEQMPATIDLSHPPGR